jgi:predicted peptidase
MRSALAAALLCAACAAPTPVGMSAQHFEGQVRRAVQYEYLLYLPPTYNDTTEAWPLVIFLHGSGEAGADITMVRAHGPPRLITEGRDFPFIMVAPQAPEISPWDIDALDLLLDHIMRTHRVDPDRVYVTGLSNGGKGAWSWAIARPDRFAALAPVAGYGDANRVCALGQLPVWAFHGALDDVVPAAFDSATVEALQRCNGNVRYTLYADVNHDSWTCTYANDELYTWLLSQRRAQR